MSALAQSLDCEVQLTDEGLGLIVFRRVAREKEIDAVRAAGFEIVSAAAVAASGCTRLELLVR